MQPLTFTDMTRVDVEEDFGDLYTLEQFVSVNYGWKVVYVINQKYFIEDVIAYASIKNGSYCEFIPITSQELHLPQSLSEFVLKDGYVGLITPENEFIVNKNTVEDIKNLNVQAIKEALKKDRVFLC